ncbi:AAA family ATPase [Neptuniibacter sp. QD48_55]|uniref:L,D-transpeptidase Cds6 family protein n=1 Tax=Neptuniibacter sp. QD48_55 TaxID=3398212 RepID=UPI0039F58381
MPQEQRLVTESYIRSSKNIPSYTEPYRHASYKRALSELRKALQSENSIILKGVAGTGKSTLINELINEFQKNGIPVAIINKPLTEVSQLYSKLSDALKSTAQTEDLSRTLQSIKDKDLFCLVIIDQQAINSDDSVINSLQQLCEIDETTKGAIKLVVVRQDYIVINSKVLQQADFINWINTEIVLDLFQLNDIEGYIHYLSSKEGLPSTPYEIGTDLLIIEHTEGRINRLNKLLLPLIHNKIITPEDINNSKKNSSRLSSEKIGMYSLSLVIFIILGFGVNYFLYSSTAKIESKTTEDTPIFAEPKPLQENQIFKVQPPSITVTEKEPASADFKLSGYKADTVKNHPPEAEQNALTQEVSITGQPVNKTSLNSAEKINMFSLKEITTFPSERNEIEEGFQTIIKIEKLSKVEVSAPQDEVISPLTLATVKIDHWIAAWQAKDLKNYFRSYKPNFTGIYETNERWSKKRRDAINRPKWIKLIREKLHNIKLSENKIKVDFWLQYEAASGYKDKTLKQLTLVKYNGEWLIDKEHNIKVETH